MMKKVERESSIGTKIGWAFRVLRHTLQRQFEACGYNITLEQWLILMILKNKGACSQYELTEACDKEKTTVTRLIDNLHKNGLVRRVQDRNDRRSNIIYVTQKGLEVERVLTPIAIELNRKALRGFSEEEIQLFFEMLDRMVKNVSEDK